MSCNCGLCSQTPMPKPSIAVSVYGEGVEIRTIRRKGKIIKCLVRKGNSGVGPI